MVFPDGCQSAALLQAGMIGKGIIERGGPVMYPLMVCSVVALAAMIERTVFWIRQRLGRDRNLVEKMILLSERGECDEAARLGEGTKDYLARVLSRGLKHRSISLKDALEIAAAEEMKVMHRGLRLLDTVITLAPLLGILGTVTGIIRSFQLLGGTGAIDPRVATVGIAEALITTAAGLAIAIPVLVAYNYFVWKANEAADEIERCGAMIQMAHIRHTRGERHED